MKKGYVDGFVLPFPKKKLAEYTKLAKLASKVWMDHGALEYVECVGDGLRKGKVTSFHQSVKLKAGEVVVFAWIVYKSRAHRDKVLDKAMNDPRLAGMSDPDAMPFDAMRMFWGGFKPIVQR